ncbi:MAG: response regulator [Leptospiraceae bacterium]|nr:response regulator [Leptospiraceae bacterium]MCP5494995.1 response regulator [Leptospiraceae bacterium]
MKVLLVDDSLSQRYRMKEIIVSNGIAVEEVDEATNGLEAYDKVKKRSYKLIFLDWNMPKMDGISFLKKIDSEGYDIPVIMVTSEGEIEYARKAMKFGAYGYITKPVDVKKVEIILNRYVNK